MCCSISKDLEGEKNTKIIFGKYSIKKEIFRIKYVALKLKNGLVLVLRNIILWDTSYKVQSSQRHLEKF